MRVLSVPGICCPNCVKKIDDALTEAKINHEVNLEAKTVSVCDCDTCMETSIEILKDLGFEAERIS